MIIYILKMDRKYLYRESRDSYQGLDFVNLFNKNFELFF